MISFLGPFTTELTEKLVNPLPDFQAQVADIYRHYGDDMVDVQSVQQCVDVNRWRRTWRDMDGAPQDLVATLDACNPHFFPGIYCALKTVLT